MRIIYALLLIVLFASCEDKGDTEKFIGTWKVESYILDGKQIMNDSFYISGILIISPDYFHSDLYASTEYGWKENSIYYRTNEKWINSYESETKFTGQIRMENGSSVKLKIWDNKYMNGIYELQGSSLVIKGTESGGRLHHMILTRYSY